AFDVRTVWFSTLFGSLSGGAAMTATMCFVVLSDITPEAERASIFLRVGAFSLLASLVMPPFAAWLMAAYDPWIPCLGGTCLMICATILCLFTPETLNFRGQSRSHEESPATEAASAPPDFAPGRKPISPNVGLLWIKKVRSSTALLFDDWRVPVLIIPFLSHMLLGISGNLILQYLSKRYGLTFSEATLLATIRSAVVVVLLFLILPWISTRVMHVFHLSAQRKDLYLARSSQIFLAVGWILVGLSPNIPLVAISLVVFSLGQGAALLTRSFLTSLLPSHHIARVYSIISVVDTVGAMLGAPFLARLFKRGLALGGIWIGLPFYFTGMLAGLFVFLLFFVGLRKREQKPGSPEDEQI
ncbi:hypothetical protein LTR37_020581, partial [Vermiconidia calcicola]